MRTSVRRLALAALAVAAFMPLSAWADDHSVEAISDRLETDGPSGRKFHGIVTDPGSLALRRPGFIVGIEKSPRELLDGPPRGRVDSRLQLDADPDLPADEVAKYLDDGKLTFVSHVVEVLPPEDDDDETTHRFLYNVYDRENEAPGPWQVESVDEGLYEASWQALDGLGRRLEQLFA
ncbi:MAG TPA: hypothetical protein VKU40_11735, partial [Thermoanaerobaculia bacterium]|nr:hypothetical protein [Thermoanaerobaculia bacterium]